MSAVNLPKEWTTLIAAECFDQISTNGIKVKTKDCHTSGLHPVIDQGQEFISGYIDDSAKLIKIDNPVIIFGDHTRNIKWVDFDFVPGADGTKILTPKEFLLPRIAFYGLKNLEIPDKGYSRHFKFLKELAVPLPPLAEQKVIADKLDTLLAQVETTKARLDRIPQILKTFRQSVLAAAVSGKLTEEWRKNPKLAQHDEIQAIVKRERQKTWLNEQFKSAKRKQVPLNEETVLRKYKQPVGGYLDEFELTQILDIPKDWLVANLDSVSIAVTGKTPSTTNEANWDGNIPFISPSQIMPSGSIVAPERNITSIAAAKTPIIPDGSVLIVCIGTIGKVGILEKESAFNQQINALIPTGAIKKEFLFMWAKTLHNWLNKTSSAVVNAAIINKSRLCLAPCPVPALEEQNEIVRCVEQLFAHADKIEQQVQAAQQRVNKLTQSILAKAFRGELTAQWRKDNTDLITGDNSAEALLAKIKAERESLTNKKKTTKKGKAKTV